MDSLPLSESMPRIGNGIEAVMSTNASNTHLRALLRTLRFSVQPGGDVGHGQRVGVLTAGVAALVTEQIDLDEPGHRVVLLRRGADRDRVPEQRPGLGV